jgi:hypothetical protein
MIVNSLIAKDEDVRLGTHDVCICVYVYAFVEKNTHDLRKEHENTEIPTHFFVYPYTQIRRYVYASTKYLCSTNQNRAQCNYARLDCARLN